MKKLFVLMFLCVVAVCAVKAQKVTVWYGVNMAKVSGDLKGDSELKFLNVGVVYTKPLSDLFDLSGGLSYVSKGCEEWTPSSFQLDVNAAWNFYSNDDVKVGILAGPYLGYVINDDDMGDLVEMNKLDYGISAGVQGSYKQFSLKIGYEFGLANWVDVSSVSSKMNSLYFRLGYSF